MQKLVFIVLLTAVNLGIYSEVRTFELMWTDRQQITNNPLVEDFDRDNLIKIWTRPYDDAYTPVPYTIWALAGSIAKHRPEASAPENGQAPGNGQAPAPQAMPLPRLLHTANLAVHIVNTALVFLILSYCVPSLIGAFLGAAVFAIHPIQVESVVWVSAFKFLIGAFFALLAIWQYLRFAAKRDHQTRGAPSAMRHLYVGTASYLLAVLSHPAMAVAPLVALIVERLIPSKSSLLRTRRPAWPLAVWLIIGSPFVIWNIVLQNTTAIDQMTPFWLRPLVATDSATFYLYKLFLPLAVAPDYGRSPAFVLNHWWVYLTWLVPVAIAIFLMYWRERPRAGFAGAAAMLLIGLLPFLGLVSFEAQSTSTVANRYAYLAMIGAGAAVGYFTLLRRQAAATLLAIGATVALGYLATREVDHWRSDEALWSHALKVNPSSPIAHKILADRFRKQGQWSKAEEHYRRVLESNTANPEPYYYLADINRMQGDVNEAVDLYQKALTLDPEFTRAYNSLGLALLDLGRFDDAQAQFEKAVALDDQDRVAMSNLGRLHFAKKQYPEAIPYLRKALHLAQKKSVAPSAETQAMLGLALAYTGQKEVAQQHLESALRLDPKLSDAHRVLADIYYAKKSYGDAAKHYTAAITTIQDDPEVYNNLGAILAMQDKFRAATDYFEKAIELRPQFPEAQNNLGMAYFHLRNFKKAEKHFEIALKQDPKLADPYYYLGDIDRWYGKTSAALAYYYSALKIDPDHSSAHYRLGDYFFKKSRYQEAVGHFRSALKNDPDNERIVARLRRAENRVNQ